MQPVLEQRRLGVLFDPAFVLSDARLAATRGRQRDREHAERHTSDSYRAASGMPQFVV